MGKYKDFDVFYFGRGVDKFPSKYKHRFDVCCASMVFLKNHMPPEALDDCHATLKTGGHFVTAMRSYLWVKGEECGFRDHVEMMIDDGKFKLVKTEQFTRGIKDTIIPLFKE